MSSPPISIEANTTAACSVSKTNRHKMRRRTKKRRVAWSVSIRHLTRLQYVGVSLGAFMHSGTWPSSDRTIYTDSKVNGRLVYCALLLGYSSLEVFSHGHSMTRHRASRSRRTARYRPAVAAFILGFSVRIALHCGDVRRRDASCRTSPCRIRCERTLRRSHLSGMARVH